MFAIGSPTRRKTAQNIKNDFNPEFFGTINKSLCVI